MKKVVFYGVFAKKNAVGGHERYNSSIVETSYIKKYSFIPLKVFSFNLRGLIKIFLYPISFSLGVIIDFVRMQLIVKKEKPSILHVASMYRWHIIKEYLIMRIAWKRGVVVLFDIRAGNFIDWHKGANLFYRWIINDIFTKSSCITVEGRKYITYIEKHFNREVFYLPNFVQNRSIKISSQIKISNSNECVLFFSGRIVKEKGVDELFDAVNILKNEMNVFLVLAGSISEKYKCYLKQKYYSLFDERKIKFLGVLEISTLYQEMEKADIFVLASKHFGEGHSNAANEAMHVGLPLIVSDQGFLPDLVSESNGIVLGSVTGDEIASAIKKIFSNKQILFNMRKASREKSRQYFLDSLVLAKLEKLYDLISA